MRKCTQLKNDGSTHRKTRHGTVCKGAYEIAERVQRVARLGGEEIEATLSGRMSALWALCDLETEIIRHAPEGYAMTPTELNTWVKRYETAAIERLDDSGEYFNVSTADGDVFISMIYGEEDALAIKFGLQMFACAIQDATKAEKRIMDLAERIMEASKKGPWHGDGLSQHAIDAMNSVNKRPETDQ